MVRAEEQERVRLSGPLKPPLLILSASSAVNLTSRADSVGPWDFLNVPALPLTFGGRHILPTQTAGNVG